jgi:hypothetical protein
VLETLFLEECQIHDNFISVGNEKSSFFSCYFRTRSYLGSIVNITSLQKAGLLASEVIAKKDIDKAISDRVKWRADEGSWCHEGKLPKP